MPDHRGPAFVDLQVNGFAGVDYNADGVATEQIAESFAAMERTGVGLCLPTIITSTFEHFRDCARRILDTRHPMVAGLHMEGPTSVRRTASAARTRARASWTRRWTICAGARMPPTGRFAC